MIPDKIQIIEGLIFSSSDVILYEKINRICQIEKKELEQIIAKLNKKYTTNNSAFHISQVAGGYQMNTIAELSPYISQLIEVPVVKLTPKVLETLAIIAYRQPITKAEIDKLRGVDSGYSINLLLKEKIIKLAGRSELAGNPLVYKTNDQFLQLFGLNSIKDLPRVNELKQMGLV